MVSAHTHNGTAYKLYGHPNLSPTVVLVHGVGLEQSMWETAVKMLAGEFSVLTYDFLGHGQSHNPPGKRTVRDYVDQLTDLLNHLEIERFALVGFSMGALISQAFASLCPSRLTHLALLHSVYQRTEDQCQGVRAR